MKKKPLLIINEKSFEFPFELYLAKIYLISLGVPAAILNGKIETEDIVRDYPEVKTMTLINVGEDD